MIHSPIRHDWARCLCITYPQTSRSPRLRVVKKLAQHAWPCSRRQNKQYDQAAQQRQKRFVNGAYPPVDKSSTHPRHHHLTRQHEICNKFFTHYIKLHPFPDPPHQAGKTPTFLHDRHPQESPAYPPAPPIQHEHLHQPQNHPGLRPRPTANCIRKHSPLMATTSSLPAPTAPPASGTPALANWFTHTSPHKPTTSPSPGPPDCKIFSTAAAPCAPSTPISPST